MQIFTIVEVVEVVEVFLKNHDSACCPSTLLLGSSM